MIWPCNDCILFLTIILHYMDVVKQTRKRVGDCANLVVDLDWNMAALQIIIVDMEE